MNTLKSQIEDLIKSNVPKNIDLAIPVGQDLELKTMLEKILELEKDNNARLKKLPTIIDMYTRRNSYGNYGY